MDTDEALPADPVEQLQVRVNQLARDLKTATDLISAHQRQIEDATKKTIDLAARVTHWDRYGQGDGADIVRMIAEAAPLATSLSVTGPTPGQQFDQYARPVATDIGSGWSVQVQYRPSSDEPQAEDPS